MFDFEKPKIEIAEISEDKRYGRFVVEPLERGYGTTLGNSLRRIMLSSLPGAAVSQVKIDVNIKVSSLEVQRNKATEAVCFLYNAGTFYIAEVCHYLDPGGGNDRSSSTESVNEYLRMAHPLAES